MSRHLLMFPFQMYPEASFYLINNSVRRVLNLGSMMVQGNIPDGDFRGCPPELFFSPFFVSEKGDEGG